MLRMTKMAAVGALCEIKNEIDSEIAMLEERFDAQKEFEDGGHMVNYYQSTLEQKKRWVRALEMAGTAMTR